MIGCWSSQPTLNAQGGHMNTNGNRNKVRSIVQKQVAPQNVTALRVRDDSGNIRVTAGDDHTGEISVHAEKVVEGHQSVAELEADLARVQVNTQLEGDTLVVRADYPRDEFSRRRINASVNYIIAIPPRLTLDLLSHSGNVEAKGAKGNATVHSDSGNVTLEEMAGTIEATSASGDVTVKNATVRGLLKLDSSSGNVRAEAIRVSGSALNVTMTSDSGNVDFEGDAGELDLRASSGNVTGKVTSALTLSQANLHTSSGNVKLMASKSLSATIHTRTDSGSIHMYGLSDANRNVGNGDRGRSRTFTMGGGSTPVKLETSSGNVEFSAR
jgi:hypothetical protein